MTRAKVIYFSGEIPQGDPEGDQRNLFRKLHLLSKERDYPILASFLETVTWAMKEEHRRLVRAQRDLLPTFESILDLTDHVVELRKTSLGGAIERVLVLAFQLGSFIAYHEAHPLEYNFQASDTFLIARGPGMLSAAAVALCPSLPMISSISADITRVAFRFGLVVDQVCRSLEVSPDEINSAGAWIYCVYGVDPQKAHEAVTRFNAEKAYAETSMASVFNDDGKSVSIGGPPSTLKTLFTECDFFKRTKNVPMKKVQGMWHTGKVYGTEHVHQIIPKIHQKHQLYLPLFSPVKGQPLEAASATDLLEQIMEEMLTQRIRWDRTIQNVTERLKQASPESTQLIAIQPSQYVESLIGQWRADMPTTTHTTEDMMSAVMDLPLGNSRAKDAKSSKIAVVGMACRFPGGADNAEKFWELLAQGRDVHSPIPSDRFNIETHVDPAGKVPNTSKTPYGCFVDNPGLFDAMFFGMSPREAEQTDPMQRLALVTAYEALEHSGYVHGRGIHARRVGTFYGQASDDYREVNSGQDVGTYFIPGGCRAFGPGRINYFFKFWGPSFSVDTACSSSLAAIQAACTSLWSGDVDMAITGGMNIITNSDVYAGLSNGHFLSPTGGCKTWDEGADGYCRADGVGSVVLKRLEDAEADNDNILGVVLAAATDHSAEAVSITHPHDVAQAHLYNQVARRAGIDPLAVGYVEMHGTGTQAGDSNEMKSVTNVFAPSTGHIRDRDSPLHIGTVKSNMGHGEAAAGIMAFVKTMLVFQKGIIPPHIGIKTRFNPALPEDLAKRNVVIPVTAAIWVRNSDRKRLAMVNNFGAAGGNTSIIIEEAAPRPRTSEDVRKAQVITVSAKTANSLQENLKALVDYIEARSELSVADLAYTLSARRNHYNYRVSVLATSTAEAASLLRPHIKTSLSQTPHSGKQVPIAFAFTGQGTFYIGIGAQLYRDSHEFRKHIDQLDSLVRRQNFASFLPVVSGNVQPEDVSIVTMNLAIVCVEIALARLWESFGIKPSMVIGHSLGEYAALAVAGVLSDSAAIFLVGTRARLLTSKCTSRTHGMLSVRASAADIKHAGGDIPFEVSCINGPNETVLGGTLSNMEALSATLAAAGYRTFKLDLPHAYHTYQMDTIVDELVKQTETVVCKKTTIPIISPRFSRVMTSEDSIDVSYLIGATRETVDFAGALDDAWQSGLVNESTIWLEMGHHPTCSGFISRTLSSTRMALPSLQRDTDNWLTLAKTLCSLYSAGIPIDWNEYHRPFEQALRLIDAPTYAWTNKNYWIQYRGDWNLTKGRAMPKLDPTTTVVPVSKRFQTSSIHRLISEQYTDGKAILSAESSITDPSLQGVVDGHAMNGYGVASSFLHAEMAFTLAKRVSDKSFASAVSFGINVADFEYHEPVVKLINTSEPQPILVSAEADLEKMEVHVKWFNPAKEIWYCHATVFYEDPSSWLSTWSRSTKLITSRIDALNDMAVTGKASKLTTDLAYSLFGKLVGYSKLYQTMQSVILNEDEAMAEVQFPEDTGGSWTVPPHFIDGLISLSGFILNGGTHFDNTNNFFITPSWKSMRFARPLTPGGRYTAYVRMVPSDNHSFVGDVYVLQGSEIVGVVEAILFLQWPRVMLNRFFRPADVTAKPAAKVPGKSEPSTRPHFKPHHVSRHKPTLTPRSPDEGSENSDSSGVIISRPGGYSSSDQDMEELPSPPAGMNDDMEKALALVAEELAVDIGLLTDDALIADLGLDSLMSLVMSQRLREELGLEIRDAFFLEITTIQDLKALLR
ncbi:non-reducing polyketide synthase PKS19-like protein [Parastagonospora nodorum]|uniref:Non-reducing polyketide synthase PKS19 n=2 Tax=Phaeosphaeria nodorum (strain SN15 / ATCC MYA-4574 / FGSC 10173) TaxID=321614 RepID=PKS19_PHANO|nr:RecName: Full=Non-reducing polyketide synthase PKS19; Short=NR-PKS PKS19; AltName: Full=Alternariol synthase; Short=AOH synthase [Parastagonospora nodorum SN15]KAH3903772.1 non-reducing polyketide synthase PKS19-like protein [Parastagonospora nodorum]AKN45693.1 polyketide synthase [Parastagonospora nodorum SN15]KAH3921052.1 non-reducing polyketide synthase PKS19-like protein [Parastagonospora nodorum]KAH3939520.1 non-reducing polyketide synthase PKS19-like protein [Parastagonospora nodorum]